MENLPMVEKENRRCVRRICGIVCHSVRELQISSAQRTASMASFV